MFIEALRIKYIFFAIISFKYTNLCRCLLVNRLWHIRKRILFSREHNSSFIKGDAEGLVNMPLQIKGVKLSISLREDTEKENLVWVSLRSVDDFPCNEMAARFFNGGGHLNASGGRLYCSLKEAEEITRKAIDAML